MKLFSDAMRAIEWVDRGDCSHPDDTDAIKKALGDFWAVEISDMVVQDLKNTILLAHDIIKQIENHKQ